VGAGDGARPPQPLLGSGRETTDARYRATPRRGRAMTDFAVVGRGLMGTACARHLAEAGHVVTLVGPDEPADRATHTDPFASHHDAARITRHLAVDADWALLSRRSIDRYRDLETRSGIRFYHPCGGMMSGPSAGPGAAFADAFLATARDEAIPCDILSGAAANARFPMLALPQDARAAFDPAGGWIDPRAFRRAEETLAAKAGATILADSVLGHRNGTLTLASGDSLSAAHVVVATGGYAGLDGLLDPVPDLRVYARTIAFVTLTEAEATALAAMPSLIFVPDGQTHDLYLLPPVRYPDGKWRIKIGGEDDSPRLTSPAEMTEWFRSDGNATVGERLLGELARVMPDLPMRDTSTGACAVSFTPTGKPIVARADADTTLLTGGNGAGAKCADELGRLGAMVATGGDLGREGYRSSFACELPGGP
jgi:sarcosine oxidase